MGDRSPWYSRIQRDVYHDHSRCTEGNNIEAHNRVSGTGNLPKCQHCARLG